MTQYGFQGATTSNDRSEVKSDLPRAHPPHNACYQELLATSQNRDLVNFSTPLISSSTSTSVGSRSLL